MDKETLKLLKTELQDDMKRLGFKTEGQWYMRLVNLQVYQTVYIQGSRYGDEFCVNIGLVPLCNGNTDAKAPDCQDRLGMLAFGYDKWWEYSAASAKDAAALMRETAFPIFDECSSYRGLFDFIKPILDGFEDVRAERFFRILKSKEWAKILLSLGETEYCKLVLNNSIREWVKLIRPIMSSTDPAEKYCLNCYTENMNKEKSFLALVESGDLSEIQEEIKRNEAASLAALTKYIVKV